LYENGEINEISHLSDDTGCLEKGQCKGGRCVPYCETLGKQSCMCDKCEINILKLYTFGILTMDMDYDPLQWNMLANVVVEYT
jgi:hypothetical protein